MREQRNDPKRLKDILQAIDTIFEYVGDRGMKEFLADKIACVMLLSKHACVGCPEHY